MKKLILATGEPDYDWHCEKVREHLNEKGYEMAYFSYAEMGKDFNISYNISNDKEHQVIFRKAHCWFEIDDVSVVWNRKRRTGLCKHYPENRFYNRVYYHEEASSFRRNISNVFTNVKWLNHPHSVDYASEKSYQLILAKKAGFYIPRTVIGNDLKSIKELIETSEKTILKAYKTVLPSHNPGLNSVLYMMELFLKNELPNLEPTEHLNKFIESLPKNPYLNTDVFYRDFMTTQKMDLQKFETMKDAILNGAFIFQEYVPKKYELRVTIVDSKIFACKIDSQATENEDIKLDWRNYHQEDDSGKTLPHSIIKLPEKIENACLEIMKNYNLNYGAIDLIVTPDDEYYFLEINPSGNYGWIEQLTGAPISETISEYLISLYDSNQ